MKEHYDVIVIGGGPGGSWAAKHAAEQGVSVLLIEKDREIGVPVRCAEGLSEIGLKNVVDVRQHWIARVIRGARLVAPDGTQVEAFDQGLGFVLHRKLFDYDLAAMAHEAGADVVTLAYGHDLIREEGQIRGVRIRHLNREYAVRCSLVIGADGVESRVGRWAGLDTRTNPDEMESCVQATVADAQIEPDIIQMYFGRDVAPGGYVWIFPKGNGMANVGLGITGSNSKNRKAIAYLETFLQRHLPNAAILTLVAGGVPVSRMSKKIAADGIMLVGDAARQTNPMTGGGILYAMVAGRIAGAIAAEAVKAGDVSEKALSAYPKAWQKAEGQNNERFYRIKTVVNSLTDDDLNRTARLFLELPPEKRTPFQLFKKALFRHPKLVAEAAKVFGGI